MPLIKLLQRMAQRRHILAKAGAAADMEAMHRRDAVKGLLLCRLTECFSLRAQ
ncbi:hypothetical protein D3C80_2152480 [compost metagenome]